jgi:RNA polymerase sigma-70 factor (ECF subfamily)
MIGQGKGLDQSQDEKALSQLMRSAQDGDAERYRQLLVRIRSMLKVYVENSFTRFGLAAQGGQEDVLQEILLAIHTKRHTYDSQQYFLPWMYAIARYKLIDYIRKNKMKFQSAVPLDDELENIEDLMSLDDSAELDLENLLKSLPEKQRHVLLLMKIEGLSIEEASQQTGFSPSDIKVTVHRAIKSLQNKVKEERRGQR